MNTFSDFGIWLMTAMAGATTIIGMIEWIKKNFFDKAPSWVWAVVALVFAIGYAYAPIEVKYGLGVLAVSQLGYDKLVKKVDNTIQ